MSVSDICAPRSIGFSTGALERGDYRSALAWLREQGIASVELSALRLSELEGLVCDLTALELESFSYISFHAPGSFGASEEERVVTLLQKVFERGWNIVVHPDVIRKPVLWRRFGNRLLLENMDRRKLTGRTVEELSLFFEHLPEARLCLDVAHARQLDTTLTLLAGLIRLYKDRIAEVHISELDSLCRHRPMSWCAVADYRSLKWPGLSSGAPVIIESMLDQSNTDLRMDEYFLAHEALNLKCEVRQAPAV
jgi:hypothetical protein